MSDKRPVFVILIGIFAIIGGLSLSVVAFFFLMMGLMLCTGAGSIIVGLMSLVNGLKYLIGCIFFISTGAGLLYFKRWARYAMIVSIFAIIYGLTYYLYHTQYYFIFLIICVTCLLYLFQPRIGEAFSKKPEAKVNKINLSRSSLKDM